MIHSITLSLAQKHLEPGESLAEILFGLIMTLSFTLAAGLLVEEGPLAVRQLLIATVGCNIAWGIIDGALYIVGRMFERGRMARLGEMIRRAGTEEAAAAIVEEELEELVGVTVAEKERADLYQRMVRHVRASAPRTPRVMRADLYGAIAVFWMVFFASIPAAIPFLFIDDAWIALRISNGILISLLFVVGYRWARYTAFHPLRTGLTLLVGGVVMVAVAIALGG